jgi:hypothetical protein
MASARAFSKRSASASSSSGNRCPYTSKAGLRRPSSAATQGALITFRRLRRYAEMGGAMSQVRRPQPPSIDSFPAPQNARNASKPGAYELVIRINNAEVAPDDKIELEVYITGYGYIDGAKIAFYPPPYIIDTEWSTWTYDFGLLPNGLYGFGTAEQSFKTSVGAVLAISPAGFKADRWSAPSLFFDTDYDPNDLGGVSQIATETLTSKAPVEFKLQTQKKIPSGTYELHFYLTYFNGQEWKIDSKRVPLTVPNWFKRNEGITWTVGVLSFLVTGCRSVGFPSQMKLHMDLLRREHVLLRPQ